MQNKKAANNPRLFLVSSGFLSFSCKSFKRMLSAFNNHLKNIHKKHFYELKTLKYLTKTHKGFELTIIYT